MPSSPFGSWTVAELRDACIAEASGDVSKRRLARDFGKSSTSSGRVLSAIRDKRLTATDSEVVYNGISYPVENADLFADLKGYGERRSGKGAYGDTGSEMTPPCYVLLDNPRRYIFILRCCKNPLEVKWDDVQTLAAAYSDLGDGGRKTIHNVAVDNRWSFPMTAEILRALGLTHASLPMTDDALAEADEGDVAHDLLRAKEGRILAQYTAQKWKDVERNSADWLKFKHYQLDPLADLVQEHLPNYTVPALDLSKPKEPFVAVLAPYDLHYGKMAWEDECGRSYTREQAAEDLLRNTEVLMEQVCYRGMPEKFIVCTGGDWFHVDTWHGSTTKGTLQDTDGSIQRIIYEGCDLACTYIDLIRQVAPVDLITIPGNHDRTSTYALDQRLLGQYRDCPDVNYQICMSSRKHTIYGDNFILFAHGSDEHKKDLPRAVSRDYRQLVGSTKRTIIFTGHLHTLEMRSDFGVKLVQMPSISGPDRWHYDHLYGAISAGAAYIMHKHSGRMAIEYAETDSVQEVPAEF